MLGVMIVHWINYRVNHGCHSSVYGVTGVSLLVWYAKIVQLAYQLQWCTVRASSGVPGPDSVWCVL